MSKPTDRELLIEEEDDSKKIVLNHEPVQQSETKSDLSKKSVCKYCHFELNGLNIIRLSILAILLAITAALFLSIIFGPPQITPHGAVIVDDKFCLSFAESILKKQKGNAVDALVSSLLCLTVTRPDIAAIGGCGAFLVHKRDDNTNSLFDAMCTAPSRIVKVDQAMPHSTVGVPGIMAGLKQMHEKYGGLPWASLFEAAIEAAKNGFQLHRSLIEAANSATILNQSIAQNIAKWAKLHPREKFIPDSDLLRTLNILSQNGVASIYSGSIGKEIAKQMNRHVPWSLEDDLGSYSVQKPAARIINFAGFNIKAFPSPFIGGVQFAHVLGNMDLLSKSRPLDATRISLGDVNVTAVVLHRLIELTKFANSQTSLLGDPYDSTTGSTASLAEDILFELSARKSLTDKVFDNKTFDLSYYGSNNAILPTKTDIGDSFLLATDSNSFTVAASLVLGSPFGSGIVVPNTGIHMNSALQLFSQSPDSLNRVAPGRRPLVPISPVLVETAHQRCGHRFMLGSVGAAQGVMDIMQILSNAILSLSRVSCSVQNFSTVAEKSSSDTLETCFPLAASMSVKRFLPLLESNSSSYKILLQSGFPEDMAAALQRLGHKVVSSSIDNMWTEIVGAVGWTKYTLFSAVDAQMSDSIMSF